MEIGYCMRCASRRKIINIEKNKINGRIIIKGEYKECKNKISKLI